jgi:lipid A disaccharide synthetase
LKIAITTNGPGEFSGWVRPLVTALYRLAPDTDVTLFFVPDDYATGREPEVARAMFPRARVVPAKAYLRFALGARDADLPENADVVQYLGGDLLHARLGGTASAYKFARRKERTSFARAFAVDAANAAEIEKAGYPRERIKIVGNLAIDGAIAEAAGSFSSVAVRAEIPRDGVLVMPGTRKHEVANLIPFFVRAAQRLRDVRPDIPIAFAISPFTTEAEVAAAFAAGGHRNVWGARGRVVPFGAGIALAPSDGSDPFPIVRDAMRHAPEARFVVTLPGTKCIELAALGVPTIVCVPLNAPEAVVINGPLQYLDRVPFAGALLKREIVVRVDARFAKTAQPNMDANEFLMPELRGTLTPAEVARRIAAYYDDDVARTTAAARLRELYARHAGAAERMARSLLESHA